jgi:ATP citrate (pro-S)-lyase
MEYLTADTQVIYFGGSPTSIQSSLDFDYSCGKATPSLVAQIKPGNRYWHNYFWGTQQILVPTYPSLKTALAKHPQARVLVNFASERSVYKIAMQAFTFSNITHQVLIAEGMPERQARLLRQYAIKNKRQLWGPSIPGLVWAGSLLLGLAGGDVTIQRAGGLHTPGHIAIVAKSGGLMNEFCHIVHQATGSVHSGLAVGGDRYPCTRLHEAILYIQQDPQVHLIVMQGEIGGTQEEEVAQAMHDKRITKPLIAWVSGIAAEHFPQEFQFGHAGAQAQKHERSAQEKNRLLRSAGAIVPETFEQLPNIIAHTAQNLSISPSPSNHLPNLTLFESRVPASIISTITNDQTGIPHYNQQAATDLAQDKTITLGSIIGQLWFKRTLNSEAVDFLDLILKLVADHGPNVAGAHNTIVTARAGKDIASAVAAGILTIGPRFGGASNAAAQNWFTIVQNNQTPHEFVKLMKQKNEKISGIGHRHKNKFNPDHRVNVIEQFLSERLPDQTLTYFSIAKQVEKITLQKNHALILNIDGAIGAAALDVLSASGFEQSELEELLQYDVLDGLFILSRTVGLIGHYIDQKRLGAPLYRHNPSDTFIHTSDQTE